MKAVIISIGDELVLGQTVDSNSAWLSARLAEYGIMTAYHKTLPDDIETCKLAFMEAAGTADLSLVTGGLGPTDDDLTRQALAGAMGVELVTDSHALGKIRAFFEKLGREMPARNAIQATHPAGAVMIENTCGTAPGIKARLGNCAFFVMPGVPHEMKTMFETTIAPFLAESGSKVILTHRIDTFGRGESTVATLLDELMARDRNPLVGTTASDGIVSVRIRCESHSHSEAARLIGETNEEIKKRLGDIIFGENGIQIQQAVACLLLQSGKTVATAESCTGGLIGKMLTDTPGSSAFYKCGWVTYSNEMKEKLLGVNPETLKTHGAVSDRTAAEMAENARKTSNADYAISATGIAGPDGGSEEKPVGTVWIGLASNLCVKTEKLLFPGDRQSVRDRTAKTALNILRLTLKYEAVEKQL